MKKVIFAMALMCMFAAACTSNNDTTSVSDSTDTTITDSVADSIADTIVK